jgi:hypothetical protein
MSLIDTDIISEVRKADAATGSSRHAIAPFVTTNCF